MVVVLKSWFWKKGGFVWEFCELFFSQQTCMHVCHSINCYSNNTPSTGSSTTHSSGSLARSRVIVQMHYEHYYRRGQIPVELTKAVEADLHTRASAAAAPGGGVATGGALVPYGGAVAYGGGAPGGGVEAGVQEPLLLDMEEGEDGNTMSMCVVS